MVSDMCSQLKPRLDAEGVCISLVMEQQPGPVNWAIANPSPAPGQVRLWLHDMIAQGSSLNNIFRWRQVPYGQEQMHAGMLRPDDVYDVAWHEQQETVFDMATLQQAGVDLDIDKGTDQAEIAIVVDFPSAWFIEAQPHSGRFQRSGFVDYAFQYGQVLTNWHTALRRLALDVDLVGPATDLSGYKLVLIPLMVNVSAEMDSSLKAFAGEVIVGPRTASKVDPMSIPDGLPPSAGALRDRLPMKVTRVESLRPNGGLDDLVRLQGQLCSEDPPAQHRCTFPVEVWSEWLECGREDRKASMPAGAVYSGYRDGKPAMCTHRVDGRQTSYLGWYASSEALMPILADAAARNGISTLLGRRPDIQNDLGGHVRFARRGDALFAFNYDDKNEANVPLPLQGQQKRQFKLVIGGIGRDAHRIGRSGVNIYHVIG